MSEHVPVVHLEVSGHVATLTLDDARRRNAMTPELGDALYEAVERVRADESVRAVVLTGAGEAFSAGGDLRMLERLQAMTPDDTRAFMLRFYARYLRVVEVHVPVIAAVRGAAIGAGLCVAMACDLMVVDESAKLALNFVQLGLHPGMGATHLAAHRVGAQRAAELLFTGRRFDGAEAARMGVALEALPADEVLPRALAIAAQIAANGPLAVRALKREIGVDRAALTRALEAEATHQAESYASRDLSEGLAAAAERRAADFRGV